MGENVESVQRCEYYWIKMQDPNDWGIMRVDGRSSDMLVGEGLIHTHGKYEHHKGWLSIDNILGDATENAWDKLLAAELIASIK